MASRMNFKKTATICIVVFGCLFSIKQSFSSPLTDSHSIKQSADGSYEIIGDDAYFSLTIKQNSQNPETADTKKSLRLNISIEPTTQSDSAISAELFFKQIDSKESIRFDPDFRIQFNFQESAVSVLNINLPDSVSLIEGQLLRLDINNCLDCAFKINSEFALAAQTNANVNITRIYNGRLVLDGDKRSVFNNDWVLNDLEAENESLAVQGEDPYLISPILDVATNSLGGVLISINAPQMTDNLYDLQLFYSTDRHRFIERASSFIRLTGSDNENIAKPSSNLDFFVPLDFLSQQIPPSTLLKRLRLDLPITVSNDGTLINQDWSINKIELVSRLQSSNHQHLISQQLTHKKRSKVGQRQIIINVANKIFNDLGFMIIYALLLLLVSFIVVRKFKAAANR